MANYKFNMNSTYDMAIDPSSLGNVSVKDDT